MNGIKKTMMTSNFFTISSLLFFIIFVMIDRASSLMCHQCQSSKDAIDHDCLTSSPNALKRCPENEEYCVIIEEFTKNNTNRLPHKYSSSSDYREEIAKTETRLSLVRTCMTHKLGNSCQDSSPPSSSDILGRNEGSEDKKNKRETVCYSFCKTDGCNTAYKNDAKFMLTIFFSILFCTYLYETF